MARRVKLIDGKMVDDGPVLLERPQTVVKKRLELHFKRGADRKWFDKNLAPNGYQSITITRSRGPGKSRSKNRKGRLPRGMPDVI
jgi:hypothetical protein